MLYVLTCDCGSRHFQYDENLGFLCLECGEVIPECQAGYE